MIDDPKGAADKARRAADGSVHLDRTTATKTEFEQVTRRYRRGLFGFPWLLALLGIPLLLALAGLAFGGKADTPDVSLPSPSVSTPDVEVTTPDVTVTTPEQSPSSSAEATADASCDATKLGELAGKASAYFDTASAQIKDSKGLNAFAAAAKGCTADSGVTFTLSGHADQRGNAAYNVQLTKERIASVQSVLTKAGVDKGLIKTDPQGKSGSTSTAQTERRVDVSVN